MKYRAACAAVISVAAIGAAGCGADDASVGRSAALVWKEEPKRLVHPTLKDDRIVRGEVKNEGLDKIRIETAEVRLLDSEGRPVNGVATFAPSYVHSLYARNRLPPGGYPEEEKRRIGLAVEIEPGQSAPLTVSWTEPRGPRTPVRIDYGSGTLAVPQPRGGS